MIESLEMDRIREAEEDQVNLTKTFTSLFICITIDCSFQSIKESLEIHSAKREEELCQQTPVKLSKKEKKKQKESKKLAKQKKIDADKVKKFSSNKHNTNDNKFIFYP